MKTKRTFLSILTLCIALLFTACSGKGTAGTEKSQNTKTESGSESADDSNSKLNDLYQQVLVAGTRTLGLRENTGGCA